MKCKAFFLLVMLALLSLGSVQSKSVEQVSFYGFVFRSFPVEPLEGAVVKAWTSDALGMVDIGVTNWHGYYEGNDKLPPGWHWFQAVYGNKRSRIERRCCDGTHPVRVDFYIEL